MPVAGLASCHAHSVHFVALATILSTWSFQHSSWSKSTPKNLCEVASFTTTPSIVRFGLGSGLSFEGLSGSRTCHWENPTKVSLDGSNCKLCQWDQSWP